MTERGAVMTEITDAFAVSVGLQRTDDFGGVGVLRAMLPE
jgi:hypothetical protein